MSFNCVQHTCAHLCLTCSHFQCTLSVLNCNALHYSSFCTGGDQCCTHSQALVAFGRVHVSPNHSNPVLHRWMLIAGKRGHQPSFPFLPSPGARQVPLPERPPVVAPLLDNVHLLGLVLNGAPRERKRRAAQKKEALTQTRAEKGGVPRVGD